MPTSRDVPFEMLRVRAPACPAESRSASCGATSTGAEMRLAPRSLASESTRPLRVMLMANNGLGAGHVTRAIAIARGLQRRAVAWGIRIELLLATTSEAETLLSMSQLPCVRWPTPLRAREAGWSDGARRELAARVLRGAVEGFRPDLLITDTFPLGPHGELAGLVTEVPRRALVRRSVRADRASDPVLQSGLDDYHVAIVPDDPQAHRPETLRIPCVRVPPITLFEESDLHERQAARDRLGIPQDAQAILVSAGGGGDAQAAAICVRICDIMTTRTPTAKTTARPIPVLAQGPLLRCGEETSQTLTVRECPLQPWLSAFDGAIVPAGYNLAHELAKAGIPSVLFGMPRPYDDQVARAERFEAAGLGRALSIVDDDTLAQALAWMESAPRPRLPAGGADAAADALLGLATGRGAP